VAKLEPGAAPNNVALYRRIGAQMALLALLAVAPFLVFSAKSLHDLRQAYRSQAETDVLRLAKVTGGRLGGYVQGVEHMLTTVGVLAASRLGDPAELTRALRELKAKMPNYVSAIQVIAPDGKVIATSAQPADGPQAQSVAERKYFKEALAKRGIAVGEPAVSKNTGKWTIAFAAPVLDAAGALRAVVSISIRLENFQSLLVADALPAGSVMTLLDERGVILARSLDPGQWVGRDISNNDIVIDMKAKKEGVDDRVSADGVRRLAGYTTASKVPWMIYVGVPLEAALEPAQRALLRLLGAALVALLLALGLAAYFSQRIVRPIRSLELDVKRFATGDLAHRANVELENEIGQLVRHFNQMAASLEQRSNELRQSEARYDLIVNATSDGVWDFDLVRGRIEWSARVQEMLGYAKGDLTDHVRDLEALIHPDDLATVKQHFLSHLRDRTLLADEFRLRARDGSYRWVSRRGRAIWDERGRALRVVGSISDVTARKFAEQEVQRLNADLERRVWERTAQLTHEVTEHKETQHRLHEVNVDLRRSLDKLQQQTQEMTLLHEMSELLQSASTFEEHYRIIAKCVQELFTASSGGVFMHRSSRDLVEAVITWGKLAKSDTVFVPEHCWALRLTKLHVGQAGTGDAGVRCEHVSERNRWGYACVPLNSHGETLGILHLRPQQQSEAEDLHNKLPLLNTVAEYLGLALGNFRLQQTLRFQSVRDPLTGLYNRRYMEESILREQARVSRAGLPLGIIMFDLDHFKRLNDTHGHDAGDAVLRALGKLLLTHVRGADIACRYGGEEFIVILPSAALEVSRMRAEELRRLVSEMKVEWGGKVIDDISISLGVASYPQHGANWEDVVKEADRALYRAKQQGRKRVVVAS
jgi:diguanylate cyclase (GGDEF)-like protein/PAS domain S-box-containing protein